MAVSRLYACCVLFVLASQTQTRPQNGADDVIEGPTYYDAATNDYVDKVLKNVRELILDKHYDPYPALEYRGLALSLVGELHGLSSIHRMGDVTIKHNGNAIEISGKFGVYDLKALLDWNFQLGFIPFRGKVGGNVEEVLIDADLRLDLASLRAILTRFKVAKVGRVKTDIKLPIPGIHYVYQIIADAVANLFKNVVVKLIEGTIRAFVQQTLDKIGVSLFE